MRKVESRWCSFHRRRMRWGWQGLGSQWAHQWGLLRPSLGTWTKQEVWPSAELEFQSESPSQAFFLSLQNIGSRENVRLVAPPSPSQRATYILPSATMPLSFLCPHLVSWEVLYFLLLATSKLRDTFDTQIYRLYKTLSSRPSILIGPFPYPNFILYLYFNNALCISCKLSLILCGMRWNMNK